MNKLYLAVYGHHHGADVEVHASEQDAWHALAQVALENHDNVPDPVVRRMVKFYREARYMDVCTEYNESNRERENLEVVIRERASKTPSPLSEEALRAILGYLSDDQAVFQRKLDKVPHGHYRDVRFRRKYEGQAQTTQFYDDKGEALADPIEHPVAVVYGYGAEVHAGVFDNGDGTASLEIEGFDYGVGYLHGLTHEDIEIL